MTRPALRAWQANALEEWVAVGHRGIAEIVTGGGKTILALACIDQFKPSTSLIVVPTLALLDQWWEEIASYFDLALDEIHVITGRMQMRSGTINVAVLNTAAKLHEANRSLPCFLIIDECHRAASPQYSAVLNIPMLASLGLSATPDRPYDQGLSDLLIPALGNVFFNYSYRDALHDGVAVPFRLENVVFELERDTQAQYDKLTKAIARSIKKYGVDAQETISLLLRRARVLNLSLNRVRLALKLIAAHRGRKLLVFHEDIEACNLIHRALSENGVRAALYHSEIALRERVLMLAGYRRGDFDVLVTCRALDEGFNVPEAEVGIIAASTATRRQRIQRLGRILRPSPGKDAATVFTLVASAPEIARLKEEEKSLEDVVRIDWVRA